MSKTCEICGKGAQVGMSVSHAQNHSKKRFQPNLRKVKLNLGGITRRVRVCAQCLKKSRLS